MGWLAPPSAQTVPLQAEHVAFRLNSGDHRGPLRAMHALLASHLDCLDLVGVVVLTFLRFL